MEFPPPLWDIQSPVATREVEVDNCVKQVSMEWGICRTISGNCVSGVLTEWTVYRGISYNCISKESKEWVICIVIFYFIL